MPLDQTACEALALKHHLFFVQPIFQSEEDFTTTKASLTLSHGGFCSAVATAWLSSKFTGEDALGWAAYLENLNPDLIMPIQMHNMGLQIGLNAFISAKAVELAERQRQRRSHQSRMSSTVSGVFTSLVNAVAPYSMAEVTDDDLSHELRDAIDVERARVYRLMVRGCNTAHVTGYAAATPVGTVFNAAPYGVYSMITLDIASSGHAIGVYNNGDASMLIDANSGLWRGPYASLVAMIEEFFTTFYSHWTVKQWKLTTFT